MSEVEINLKALKKVDPYVKCIEAHCSNVALYNFNSDRAEWEKTQVEGTLFLFQREAEPKYGFTIMNRLNPENHIEPVTGQLDFQIQPPFLLYKNSNGEIRGIWFFSKNECEAVGKKIQLLVKEVEQEREERERRIASSGGGGGGGGNLAFLLENAERQKQESQLKATPTTDVGKNLLRLLSQPENAKPSPLPTPKEEPTGDSVKDFFALASNSSRLNRSTPQFGDAVPGSNGGMMPPLAAVPEPRHPQVLGHPVNNFQQIGFGMQPVIQALPISQGLAMGAVPVTGFSPYAGNGSVPHLQTLFQGSVSAMTVEKLEEEQRKSSSPPATRNSISPQHIAGPAHNAKNGLTGLSDLSSQLKQQLQIGGRSSSSVVQEGVGAGAPLPHTAVHSLLRGNQPTLLSPQVFSESVEHSPSPQVPHHAAGHAPGNGPAHFPPDRPTITPLTRRQMVEAFEYLLETDEGFTEQLHHAYIQSLSTKFKVLQ